MERGFADHERAPNAPLARTYEHQEFASSIARYGRLVDAGAVVPSRGSGQRARTNHVKP
jgi:hypothetical protein